MSILVSLFTATNLFFFRKLEFSINNEHDYGHYDTQRTDHKVRNAQKLILASHPGYVAENHLLCSIKAQNRIIWGEHVKDMRKKCPTFTVKWAIILCTIYTQQSLSSQISEISKLDTWAKKLTQVYFWYSKINFTIYSKFKKCFYLSKAAGWGQSGISSIICLP